MYEDGEIQVNISLPRKASLECKQMAVGRDWANYFRKVALELVAKEIGIQASM